MEKRLRARDESEEQTGKKTTENKSLLSALIRCETVRDLGRSPACSVWKSPFFLQTHSRLSGLESLCVFVCVCLTQ